MTEPLWLVRMAFEVQARDKGFVTPHDDHDQQVRNHDHVNQGQHDQHDHRFIQGSERRIGFVAYAADQGLQCGLAAKCRFEQVDQFDPKMEHIDRLCGDQSQVKRQLQPSAGKNKVAQGAQFSLRDGLIVGHGFPEICIKAVPRGEH